MMVRPAEEEVDVEVRREDQHNINKFARLNARLQELKDERSILKVRLKCQCVCVLDHYNHQRKYRPIFSYS
jgi:hypothetical protein